MNNEATLTPQNTQPTVGEIRAALRKKGFAFLMMAVMRPHPDGRKELRQTNIISIRKTDAKDLFAGLDTNSRFREYEVQILTNDGRTSVYVVLKATLAPGGPK